MKILQTLLGLLIVCSSALAAAPDSVYHNKEYGISVRLPSAAVLCPVPSDQAEHGAALLLGTHDLSLCTTSSGKRWISIFAGYNAAEVSKTLPTLLSWQCSHESSGACGPAPAGLRISGLRTEAARINHQDGSIEIIVVAQAGKPDPDFDASVPSINYTFTLTTKASYLDEDVSVFRAFLSAMRISPRMH